MTTAEERKKRRDVEIAREQRLRASVDALLKTEPGRQVFAYLFNICGYSKPNLLVNPRTGKVEVDGTVYNEARRIVYLQLRNLATDRKALMEMETEAEAEVDVITPPEKEESK